MAEFKIVVSDPKSKKSYQKAMEQKESQLLGKKVGDKLKGDVLGLTGYELQITGGSDNDGFPMRSDVQGTARKRLLVTGGIGFHSKKKGERKRKSIRGNTVSPAIAQINTKVVTYGNQPVEKLLGKAEKAAEKKAGAEKEAPRKEPEIKEEPKKEESKAGAPKAEKPEEKKE